MICTLKSARELAPDVFHYEFSLPEALNFKPGQFMTLKVKDELPPVTRSYSIASAPNGSGEFALCIKLIPGGRGSEYLRKATIGAELEFMGPFGHFVLEDSPKDIVMVATGTGLAPFMGMLPVLFQQNFAGKIHLLFGVRHEEELFYQDELAAWAATHPNFTFVSTLSRPSETWKGATGRVTEQFQSLPLDLQNTLIYICGNGQMVKDIRTLALEKGLDKKAIHLEQFSPA